MGKREVLPVAYVAELLRLVGHPTVPDISVDKKVSKETTITTAILKWLNAQPECEAIKLHISGLQRAGDPDIFFCLRGRMGVIEVKVPGKKPTPLQEHRLAAWAAAGALTAVVHSLAEARAALGAQ